jgi:hypothetical protein
MPSRVRIRSKSTRPPDGLCAAIFAVQERDAVKNALKHAGPAVAGMLPAARSVRLGTHGLAAMIIFAAVVVVLAVLGRRMLRWIIDSRSGRAGSPVADR